MFLAFSSAFYKAFQNSVQVLEIQRHRFSKLNDFKGRFKLVLTSFILKN